MRRLPSSRSLASGGVLARPRAAAASAAVSYLLDHADVPDAWGAYSFRQLRAAYSGDLYREDAGIDRWYDQGPTGGRDWEQDTDGDQPQSVGTSDGFSYAELDGSSAQHFWNGPDMSGISTAAEIYIVLRKTLAPGPAEHTGLCHLGTASQGTYWPWTQSQIFSAIGSTARHTTVNPGITFTDWHCGRVLTKAGEWTGEIDGTQFFTTGTNTVGFRSAPKLGTSHTAGFRFHGDIAELLIFDEELDADARAAIESSIEDHYGITFA